ncbi:MAG TPA: FG-GAP-like repeat-containing protein [Terriglobales bacterium]|nr:FG-GAP-like repeat-containing protein [Terriglobales bacterium]
METALARRSLPQPVNLGRRNFLIRCCQGASAILLPAGLRAYAQPPTYDSACRNPRSLDGNFHLLPHYRTPDPLEDVFRQTDAGHDQFVSEKYHDQIAAIFAQWSLSLRKEPHDLSAIAKALGDNFSGTSLRPAQSRVVRSGGVLEVHRNTFADQNPLQRDAFLRELQQALSGLSSISTAEFQVTSIRVDSASRLQTRVRYELVGSGPGFYREQRVGHWEMEWEPASGGGFLLRAWRALEETVSRSATPIFADITAQAFGGSPSYSLQLLHGADYWRTVLDGACGIDIYGHNGISIADIDNDGFDDVYICQPAGLPNRLFRNRGDGTFEDITESSGVGILENTACAIFADFDNDGRQDLIVVRANGPLLFLNQGGGIFRQRPDAFKFVTPPQGTFTGAAAADYDRDGWLAIYFCLYIYYQGASQYRYPCPYYDAENGPPNFLMRNGRDGTFHDVTAQAGLDRNNTRYSFCCGWADFNGNGWPDLYVVNDFGRKNLYRNNGDGTFTDVASQAGVEDTGAGMGICCFDYDNDGAHDLYVADMWTAAGERISTQDAFQKNAPAQVRSLYRKHAMGNSLFRNIGNGSFRDATASAGVGMGRWSWSCDAWDFDHDGLLDLYIANGMISGPSRQDLNSFFWRQVVANSPLQARTNQAYEQGWDALNELIRSDGTWSGYERNVFYANNGDGTFSNVSAAVGLDLLEDGRAFALADFDHDGRLEVFLKNRNAPQLRVLRNVVPSLPPSIAFCLRGTRSNRDAIGAVVTLRTDLGQQTRQLQAGSGFLAQHSKEVFFGLGKAKEPVHVSIRWPSGLVQEFRDLPPNHRIWVEEGADAVRAEPFRAAPPIPQKADTAQEAEPLPATVETWLLAPVTAPDFTLPYAGGKSWSLAALRGKPVLLHLWSTGSASCADDLERFTKAQARWAAQGLQLLAINCDSDPSGISAAQARSRQLPFPVLRASADVAAIYNILYRYLFDRHRDLVLPASFLIDEKGEIVKLYQGAAKPEQIEEDSHHLPGNANERLAKALPFAGVTSTFDSRRNYLSYGSVYYQHGYFDQAQAFFELALRDDPESAEALYGLGSAYLKKEQRQKARQSFERAVKLPATYPDTLPKAWNNLGLLTAEEGRMAEAALCFQQALRFNPDYLVALENLGNAYRQQRQWDQARAAFERALTVDPQSPGANYGLAMVYAASDDTTHTYDYLQKALQFRPDYPEALNNLGVLYVRTGRRDEAVSTLQKCISVAPAFDQCYLNLARIYSLEGNPSAARAVLLQLLNQHPGHSQAQKALADLPQ